MQFDTPNNSQSLEYIIIQAISEKQITKKMTLSLFVISVLEKNKKADPTLLKMKKRVLDYIKSQAIHKKINFRDSVIDTEAISYFGKDYGEDDLLKYDIDTEKLIIEIDLLLIDVFSSAYIKATKKETEDIDLDGTDSSKKYR